MKTFVTGDKVRIFNGPYAETDQHQNHPIGLIVWMSRHGKALRVKLDDDQTSKGKNQVTCLLDDLELLPEETNHQKFQEGDYVRFGVGIRTNEPEKTRFGVVTHILEEDIKNFRDCVLLRVMLSSHSKKFIRMPSTLVEKVKGETKYVR